MSIRAVSEICEDRRNSASIAARMVSSRCFSTNVFILDPFPVLCIQHTPCWPSRLGLSDRLAWDLRPGFAAGEIGSKDPVGWYSRPFPSVVNPPRLDAWP